MASANPTDESGAPVAGFYADLLTPDELSALARADAAGAPLRNRQFEPKSGG